MKKIAVLAAALLLVAAPAFAGDIVLDTPIPGATTTRVTVDSFEIFDSYATAMVAWRDAGGGWSKVQKVTLRDSCSLPEFTSKATCEAATPDPGVWDNAYSAVANYKVKATDTDKALGALVEKQVRQEVKRILGIAGTVN